MNDASATSQRLIYVGCRTTKERKATGRGLTTWSIPGQDASAGADWEQRDTNTITNPSFLMLDGERQLLWTVHGDFGECTVYSLDDPLHPKQLMTVSTEGRNPVHLGEPRPDTLLVANYATGTVASFHLDDRGLPDQPVELLELPGDHGPHPTQQTSSHPHQIYLDPTGPLAWVPDKGLDEVFCLDVRENKPRIVGETSCPPGSGPRHCVRHPRLDLLYVAEELSSVLAIHQIEGDPLAPELTHTTRMSTRASEATGDDNTAAGIVITPDGSTVVVSNRGDDTITRFHLDEQGQVTSTDTLATGVSCPRFICLSPDGDHLVIAGETSSTIAVIDITAADPEPARVVASTGSPTCVVFADEPLDGQETRS